MPERYYAVHHDWVEGYASQVPVGIYDEHGESFYLPDFAQMKSRGHRASGRPEGRSWVSHLQWLTDTSSAYNSNWGIVEAEFSLHETMEGIWRGFIASSPATEPLRFLAVDSGDPESEPEPEPQVAAFEPSARFVAAESWWIASELVRRHPGLVVHEMHPGGGMYDVLCLFDPRDGDMWQQVCIMLNRAGRIQVHHPPGSETRDAIVTTWAESLAANDPHEQIKALEVSARLEHPKETPTSRPITLTYRLIATLLNITLKAKERWDVRNEFIDSSSDDEQEVLGHIDKFTPLREHLRGAATLGLPHEPESHCWIVLRDDEPVAAITVDGRAYTRDRAVNLLPAYERAKRSILRLATETFGDLL
ncbi:TY-Chap2 family putative peptide chaperone [Microcella pacifica]|uniref:T3SS peptide-binding chaperone domain-containing protein n=1 Tax=Microcella pacifica TaxID=2591847 RepID=A0A9E5JN82_9MICO|nr:hypothetical protein [Microcella pacifica]NHF63745.1 hypothetical protein [Microcella pacifica]